MALPAALQALYDRLQGYNGDPYNATSNPLGIARGGNQNPIGNFLKLVKDYTAFGKGISDLTAQAGSDATQTAADRVQTGKDVITTGQYRDRAQEWANKPEDQVVADGQYSARHFAEKAADQVPLAAAEVTKASDQVALAAIQATRLTGTSTTSVTPSIAPKTFTTQAGKAFDAGSTVLVQSRGNADRWMSGRVTAYDDTSLTVAVEAIGSVVSAGADWDIRISGVRGAQGIQGIPGIATMPYAARSSNTQLVVGNSATIFDLTGTFTQTFAAASSLTANWYCVLRNAGTGDITLDPNGSETIDGLASFVMYPGEARIIQCDGAALRTVLLQPGTKTFDSSGNLIWPPGVNGAIVDAFGGGGGGGRTLNGNTSTGGCGGGGGGRATEVVPAQSSGQSISASVGSGGPGATTAGGTGAAGGDTIMGSLVCARGGKGGDATNNGGNGGAASFNEQTMTSSYGALGYAGTLYSNGASLASDRGGAAGGNGQSNNQGGGSAYGGSGGGGGGYIVNGTSGSNGGDSGRAGSLAGQAGGAGANSSTADGSPGLAGLNAPDGRAGQGGSGGGASSSTSGRTGGKGGNGGFPSGGGGGGGGGATSGNGGNGGAGRIIVRFF